MRTDFDLRPHVQATHLVIRSLTVIMVLAGFAWIATNIREVPPQSQAVIFRFGAIDGTQEAGLVLALPEPFNHVEIIPSSAAVIERNVRSLARSDKAVNFDNNDEIGSDADAGSGFLLTADASVAQLNVSIFYKVSDPGRYVLQRERLGEAIDRLVARNAAVICAGRDLDAILVARPELVATDNDTAAQREQLKADLLRALNQSLFGLESTGAGLGVEIDRLDIRSTLPKKAINAFNAVLTASQQAEAAVAQARTDAANSAQAANQESDRILSAAEARSSERLSQAKTDTATISSLATSLQSDTDPALLTRLYRDRVSKIFAQAGSIITIDPKDDTRLILQGLVK